MKKYFLILFLTLIFIQIAYAQTVTTQTGSIICYTSNPPSQSCFLGIYFTTNSHTFLCNQSIPAGIGMYIGCNITTSSDVGSFYIPINFSIANCQSSNTILYLYHQNNSHVSLSPEKYPVCIGPYFSNVLNVSVGAGQFLLISLYQSTNSHVMFNQTGPVPIYLNITDTVLPNITYNLTQGSISPPVTVSVNFSDDEYLYYCEVYVNNNLIDFSNQCRYQQSYNTTFEITSQMCPPGQCTVKYIAVDLAGNLEEITQTYNSYAQCLQISLVPSTNIIILNPFIPAQYYLQITDPLSCTNFTNSTISFPLSDCNGVSVIRSQYGSEAYLGNITIGSSITIPLTFYPLRAGVCNFLINFNAYINGNTSLPYSTQYTFPLIVNTQSYPKQIVASEEIIFSAIVTSIILIILLL